MYKALDCLVKLTLLEHRCGDGPCARMFSEDFDAWLQHKIIRCSSSYFWPHFLMEKMAQGPTFLPWDMVGWYVGRLSLCV